MMKKYVLAMIIAAAFVLSLTVGVPFGVAGPPDAAGSLKGAAKFEGTALKPTRIDMSADPNCVKAHPTPATTEDILVGANGGLANVIVYVSDGLGDRTFQPPQQPVV